MYFVAVTRGNSNPALGFEFLYHLKNIFKAYFGEDFDEDTLRDNMTLIYELMDETMDYGYPQNCAIDILRLYINLGSVKAKDADAKEPGQLTSQITGVVDWRREGLRYRKNEVYIDVLESVNLLMSASGASTPQTRARVLGRRRRQDSSALNGGALPVAPTVRRRGAAQRLHRPGHDENISHRHARVQVWSQRQAHHG